jgi:hypothetical protein
MTDGRRRPSPCAAIAAVLAATSCSSDSSQVWAAVRQALLHAVTSQIED